MITLLLSPCFFFGSSSMVLQLLWSVLRAAAVRWLFPSRLQQRNNAGGSHGFGNPISDFVLLTDLRALCEIIGTLTTWSIPPPIIRTAPTDGGLATSEQASDFPHSLTSLSDIPV